ncbi:MAG: dephospho-CoA kinase [Armatimonadetes bacterium]|nr:dephospho-CoA kinase [Armatimonadota bacterium]
MLIVGLTGLIAAGKSSVAALLGAYGADVIDCDQLTHEVLAVNSPGLAAVAERFGDDLLRFDGSLDRARLGAIVFAERAALADLERIVHPLVAQRRAERIAACTAPVAVVEAIKLVESGYHRDCHALWVVTAPLELRVQRLVHLRGMDEADARARIAAQGSDADKVRMANEVIVNDGGRAWLERQTAAAWQRTLAAEDEAEPATS